MKITFDKDDLRPLIEQTVRATLEEIEGERQRFNGRLSYGESEAAELLGIPRHSLRDLRLAGRVKASRLGRRVAYTRATLIQLLAGNEIER